MRLVLTLFLLAVSLALSVARVRQRTHVTPDSTDLRSISGEGEAQSSDNDEKYIKRLLIRNQTGLDGKVRRIHLNRQQQQEDRPGIRAYGLPKRRLQDNGVIERVLVLEDRHDGDASRNSRLVEAYGMPKDRVETNGFIERLPFAVADRQSVRLDERDEAVRARRSVRGGTENKVEEKIASEAEDMVAQDSKVFRPLFVYRQQMAARQNRKHARKLAHRYHRHANHQSCDHRRSIY